MRRKVKPESSFRISASGSVPVQTTHVLVSLETSEVEQSQTYEGVNTETQEIEVMVSGPGQKSVPSPDDPSTGTEPPNLAQETSVSQLDTQNDDEESSHHIMINNDDDDDDALHASSSGFVSKIPGLAREYVSIHDDVYNLLLMGKLFSHAFYYFVYVFALKLTLYSFLAREVFLANTDRDSRHEPQMLAAQFLMLPIAVAMQDDLTATFYLIGNVKYCKSIEEEFPDAKRWKYEVATICRALDGLYSLIVNFVVLVSASDILSLFLNFAALQFLQTIDNIALDLAADGYLTEQLEGAAISVQQASLPKRSETNWLRSLDTVFYCGTVGALIVCWAVVAVANTS